MRRLLLAAAALLGAALSVSAQAQAAPRGVLTIRFLDVGQGDAVLITAPTGQTLLYDGGRSEPRMRELLQRHGVTSLSMVVASHGDADHITGLIPAIERFRPPYFLNNGIAATTQTWNRLVQTAAASGTQGVRATNQTITLGGVSIRVLAPPPGMPAGDQNLNSVGLLVQYGTFRALMTGDSGPQQTAA